MGPGYAIFLVHCLFLLLTVTVMATPHFRRDQHSRQNSPSVLDSSKVLYDYPALTKQLGLSLVVWQISLYALSAKITSLCWNYILFVLLFLILWFLDSIFLSPSWTWACADFFFKHVLPVRPVYKGKWLYNNYKQFFRINYDFYILELHYILRFVTWAGFIFPLMNKLGG